MSNEQLELIATSAPRTDEARIKEEALQLFYVWIYDMGDLPPSIEVSMEDTNETFDVGLDEVFNRIDIETIKDIIKDEDYADKYPTIDTFIEACEIESSRRNTAHITQKGKELLG